MNRSPIWRLPAALLLATALPTGCSDETSPAHRIDESRPAATHEADTSQPLPPQGERTASEEPPLAAHAEEFVTGPIMFPPVADAIDERSPSTSADEENLHRLPRTGDGAHLPRRTPAVQRDAVFSPEPLPHAQPAHGECIIFEPTSAAEAKSKGVHSVWSHAHRASDLAGVKSVLIGSPPPADATMSPVVGQQWASSDTQSLRRLPAIAAD